MASSKLTFTTAALNAKANAALALLNVSGAGKLIIMDANKNTLAILTFSATAFGAASNGLATANAITKSSSNVATGKAALFKATDGASTEVFSGSVGIPGSGEALIVDSLDVVIGEEYDITSITYQEPNP